jgi:hypothetical protein
VAQQVGGILVNAICACALKFILAIAARKQTHSDRTCPPSCEEIPDAVSHDHGVCSKHSETFGGSQEQIRVGLCALDLVSRDDRHVESEL